MADVLDDCLAAASAGATPIEVVALLHTRGVSIVESMRIIKYVFKLPLREAKAVVATADVWKDVVDDSEPLHDAMDEDLRRVQDLQRQEDTSHKADEGDEHHQ